MIFDRLADAIAKHAKLIVVMWVIILICSVPLAMKSSEVMKYDINEIAAENSESVRGMEIMDRYFPSGGGTVSS
ncbi:MAG: hypothetical protein J5494_04925, partial [Candidatus Methanomethylophilaceae archaeon]|nr:hypothetical protein [Candidatus Methanomethylophilaceae archaeon]